MFDDWQGIARKLINDRGLKQDKLAEKFGVSSGAFNHWMRGRREPKFTTILQLLHNLGMRRLDFDERGRINLDFPELEKALFAGPDEKRTANEIDIAPSEVQENAHSYPIFATRTEIELLPKIQSTQKLFLTGKTPIRGSGFWMRIKTEAMSAPSGLSIPDGSTVLFDTGIQPYDGCLALFQTPTSPTLLFRQYQVEAGTKHLKGLNPKWPTVLLPKGAKCLGVAVELRLFFGKQKK